MKHLIKNCAIYTRKSTDERLDMEFNSLDAQREACLAYIASQKSEGWVPVLEEYDDGGFSGGNMERPALMRLMDDIRAGKVQTVVVYKIDRLTRSLMDFAKLVEVFDAHGVTFVSITQSFNTTTSMGRLTLNVLLSFAQFEREVAGERIRDKIAASKRKGMWMGGTIPLGYDVKDRQLVINEVEAERVRHIFRRYLELGSLNDLYQDLNNRGVKGKPRQLKDKVVEPAPFCSSTVQYLLSNPTYIGKVRHKGQIYDGQHESIIPPELWQEVQGRLTGQSMTTRDHRKYAVRNVLRGLLFDSGGIPYIPAYTNKKGLQYRYYQRKEKISADDVLYRLPAHEIESRVEDGLRQELSDFDRVSYLLGLDASSQADLVRIVSESQISLSGYDLIRTAVRKVIIQHESIIIEVSVQKLSDLIAAQLKVGMPQAGDTIREIRIPYITRRAHRGAIRIDAAKDQSSGKDPLDLPSGELRNLVRGLIWRDEHFGGTTLRDIGKRDGFSEGYVGKCIFRGFKI